MRKHGRKRQPHATNAEVKSLRKLVRKEGAMIITNLSTALDTLDASVAALGAKVDQVIAAGGVTGATAAEQQAVAAKFPA